MTALHDAFRLAAEIIAAEQPAEHEIDELARGAAGFIETEVRRLMAEKMDRAEAIARRNRELEPWVRENPEIVAKIEQRLKVADATRQCRVAAAEKPIQPAEKPGIRYRM